MKIGRLVLTYRTDTILPLKEFYLGGGRTEFLVIGYNSQLVDPAAFEQSANFKLEPYFGKGGGGSIVGQQFIAWRDVVKKYPEIDAWVMHDYDLLAKPADAEIFSHIKAKTYGSIGKKFANWQDGMSGPTTDDSFPYPYHYVSSVEKKDPDFLNIEKVLLKYFPAKFENIPTIYTGNSDFIAATRETLMLLDDPRLDELKVGGVDQVTHTVFSFNGLEQVDLKDSFSASISLDNDYPATFGNKYDFSHPVKFWPTAEEIKAQNKK